MDGQQLELGFDGSAIPRTQVSRQRRHCRAAFWFERMRQVVDRTNVDQPPGEFGRLRLEVAGRRGQLKWKS